MKVTKEIKEAIKQHIENYEYRSTGQYLHNGGYVTCKKLHVYIEAGVYVVKATMIEGNDMDGWHTTYDDCNYWVIEDNSTPDGLRFISNDEFEKRLLND